MNPPFSHRRSFLQSAGVVGLGLAAAPSPPLSAAGPLAGRVRIAVKFHMIREPGLSVLGKFRLLQDIGFDGTELKTKERVDPDEIAAAVTHTGLPVHGIINSSDPEIVPAIELAVRLGADSVLTWPRVDPNRSYEENFRHWQGVLGEALPRAEEAGVPLCVENVRNTFLLTAEGMARFIDSFESPWVRSYFDLGNTISWTDQPAEHWARVLGTRIEKLDIKDRGHPVFGDPKRAKPNVVGTDGGEVHWANVRRELERIAFSGWATAEVAGGDRDRLAGIGCWMRDVLDLVP